MNIDDGMTTQLPSSEYLFRLLKKTEEQLAEYERLYEAGVRFRASIQRIAAHVAANDRSMGWVADELADALSKDWLAGVKKNG